MTANSLLFEIKRVITNTYETLTENELLEKLEKSRKHVALGMYSEAKDVSINLRAKYGL